MLRVAGDADTEGIVAVVHSVLREYSLTPDPAHTDADLYSVDTNYNAVGGRFWVLDMDGIVGTCGMFRVDAATGDLRKMYLLPAWRGQGWGRQMLNQALDWARAQGFSSVTLDTHSHLTEAIALYRRNGFIQRTQQHAACGRCDMTFELLLTPQL